MALMVYVCDWLVTGSMVTENKTVRKNGGTTNKEGNQPEHPPWFLITACSGQLYLSF